MAADKMNRKANSARSKDAALDNGSNADGKRDLARVTPGIANKSLTRSRLTDTLFLAHLFASRFQEPQPPEQRRTSPAADNASYRKNAKRPAKRRRIVSEKR